jgi:hypothetical protein
MANRTDRAIAGDLYKQWLAAIEGQRVRGRAIDDKYEQDCYDRLIEHVELHGLNYTRWDPRGPKDEETS